MKNDAGIAYYEVGVARGRVRGGSRPAVFNPLYVFNRNPAVRFAEPHGDSSVVHCCL